MLMYMLMPRYGDTVYAAQHHRPGRGKTVFITQTLLIYIQNVNEIKHKKKKKKKTTAMRKPTNRKKKKNASCLARASNPHTLY